MTFWRRFRPTSSFNRKTPGFLYLAILGCTPQRGGSETFCRNFVKRENFFSCFSKTPQTSHKQRGVGGKYVKFFIAIDHPHAFVSEEKKSKISTFFEQNFFVFQFQKVLDVRRSYKKNIHLAIFMRFHMRMVAFQTDTYTQNLDRFPN